MPPTIIFQGKEASLLELSLFLELASGPLATAVLAERLSLHPLRAQALFDGLVAIGLLERRAGRYDNTAAVTRLLERRNDGVHGSRSWRWLWSLPAVLSVVVLVGAVLVRASQHHRPLMTMEPASPRADQPAAAPARRPSVADDMTTYMLVGSQEQADTVSRDVQAGHTGLALADAGRWQNRQAVVVVISSADQEAELRRTIDAANTQLQAYDEPGFQVIDLRSLAP